MLQLSRLLSLPDLLTLLGLLAAAVGVASSVPQLQRLRRSGTTAGLSAASTTLGTVSVLAWLTYGTAERDPAQMIANAPSALLAIATLALLARHRRRPVLLVLASLGALVVLAVLLGPGTAAVGVIATTVGTVRQLPQVRLAVRGGDLRGLAPGTYALALASAVVWAAYGLGRGDEAVVVSSLLALACNAVVLFRRVPPRTLLRAAAAGRLGSPARSLVTVTGLA
ncbi:MAG: SemiSWEET family transporter [Motilibacteraceae bacterium]